MAAAGTCVFCAIVAGAPAHLVWEDDHVIAFLDRRPLFRGHTLVIPRAPIETLADLPVAQVGGFFLVVQRLAVAVEEAMGAEGTFVAINNRVSQSVPHLHCHVVPRTKRATALRVLLAPPALPGRRRDGVGGRRHPSRRHDRRRDRRHAGTAAATTAATAAAATATAATATRRHRPLRPPPATAGPAPT